MVRVCINQQGICYIIQLIKSGEMLNQELIDILNEVKRTQLNSGFRLASFVKAEDQQLYSDVSCHLLNVRFPYKDPSLIGLPLSLDILFLSFQINIQVCDWLNNQPVKIQKTTKFLAKSYCDQYLDWLNRSNRTFDPQNEDLLVYSSIRIAIKFNELSEISDAYSIDFFIRNGETDFTQRDFLNFEVQLLIALSYRLKISTPYDLLPLNQLLTPLITIKQLKKIIPIIDFSLSIVEFAKLSASQIFFSCFLVQAHKILEAQQFDFACSIVQAILRSDESWVLIQKSANILRQNVNAFFKFSQ